MKTLMFTLLLSLAWRVPFGYEDRAGFHFGFGRPAAQGEEQ